MKSGCMSAALGVRECRRGASAGILNRAGQGLSDICCMEGRPPMIVPGLEGHWAEFSFFLGMGSENALGRRSHFQLRSQGQERALDPPSRPWRSYCAYIVRSTM